MERGNFGVPFPCHSSSHPPVISPGDTTGQSRVGSLRAANTKFEAHVSVRLRPDVDGDLLLASGAGDRANRSVLRVNPYTFILSRADRRAPGTIESARCGGVGRRWLRGTTVNQDYCDRSYDD